MKCWLLLMYRLYLDDVREQVRWLSTRCVSSTKNNYRCFRLEKSGCYTCPFKNWSIFMGDLPFQKLVYFHRRHAISEIQKFTEFHQGLFSKKIQKYLCNALGFHGMHVSLPALKYSPLFLCSIIIGCLCLLSKAFLVFFYSSAHLSLLYPNHLLKCKCSAPSRVVRNDYYSHCSLNLIMPQSVLLFGSS